MNMTFRGNRRKRMTAILATPEIGMRLRHIYGEFGEGIASIVSVSHGGKRIFATTNKYGYVEKHGYVHTVIPADSLSPKIEFYVREDQIHLVFSERIFLPIRRA